MNKCLTFAKLRSLENAVTALKISIQLIRERRQGGGLDYKSEEALGRLMAETGLKLLRAVGQSPTLPVVDMADLLEGKVCLS